ncbi:MAG: acetolactate decarboxylase [Firmicutes bacterium]|nr:acetolactate decarboxylase [Bacillota bacterium]
MKRFCLAIAAVMLLGGCSSAATGESSTSTGNASADSSTVSAEKTVSVENDRESVYQVSLLQGLTLGDYYGSVTVGKLKEKGDTGIGTFEGVNGELIMLDGVVYRAKEDGSVEVAPDEETIPFADVTFFDNDTTEEISNIANIDELKSYLDKKVDGYGKNRFYMIKISGKFKSVYARSELKQEEPYKTLAEALSTDQREFTFSDTEGTVVGLYCPEYMNDLNAVGWHFHYVSDDKQNGGHVLGLEFENAKISWDNTDGFNMQLPETQMFPTLDLTIDQSEDIHKVEQADGK